METEENGLQDVHLTLNFHLLM